MHSRNDRTMAEVQGASGAGKKGCGEEQDLVLRVSGHCWGIYSSRNKTQFLLRTVLRQWDNGGRGLPRDVFPPEAVVPAPDPGQQLHGTSRDKILFIPIDQQPPKPSCPHPAVSHPEPT